MKKQSRQYEHFRSTACFQNILPLDLSNRNKSTHYDQQRVEINIQA